MEMGYHHASEPESFQNQTAALEVLVPALRKVFEEGSTPVATLRETARLVEQTQVRK
jgi:hypothetical protein